MNLFEEINDEYHFFSTLCDERHEKAGPLMGKFISVKDCICVQGVESRAGSAILNGYKPPFDATVVRKVKAAAGNIIGKTAQDEFGHGTFSTNIQKGVATPLNPYDKERACGGSSGGAAGITAEMHKRGLGHIALAESTGGSIVCPASFCGVVGLCPTYGRVSRYGLMDYGNSLDKIGPIAATVEDAALMLDIISGHDPKDSTSVPDDRQGNIRFGEVVDKGVKGLRIGVIKEAFGEGVDEEVAAIVRKKIDMLKEKGALVEEVSLPMNQKYGVSTYYIIAMCETSTNLAKYCGIRYGATEKLEGGFNEYFTKVRSEHFGKETKRRIMIGTFARNAGYRDAYYLKATKVRTKLIEEYKALFQNYDVLVSPTMPFIAPKFSEIEKMTPLQNYMADIMTVGPNLAGLPHISVNAGKHSTGMPVGIMFIANHFNESKLIQAGKEAHDVLEVEHE